MFDLVLQHQTLELCGLLHKQHLAASKYLITATFPQKPTRYLKTDTIAGATKTNQKSRP